MKVDNLIALLEKFRGFDVIVRTTECAEGEWGIRLHDFDLSVTDIGHSDKTVILGIEEIK